MSELLIVYSVILPQPKLEYIILPITYVYMRGTRIFTRGGYELKGVLQFKIPDFQMSS